MLRQYFSDFSSGRLQRVPFAGYTFLLGLLLLIFVFGTAAMVAGMEHAIGGNLMVAQDAIRTRLAMPYMIILAIFMIALFIAGTNIAAKRARDIGLPGWIFVIAIFIISVFLTWFFSQIASRPFSALVAIVLLFTPSDTLKGNK